MVGQEGRDEIVTMVVAGVAAKRQVDPRRRARRLKQLGPKLLFEERVGLADAEQNNVPKNADGILSAIRLRTLGNSSQLWLTANCNVRPRSTSNA